MGQKNAWIEKQKAREKEKGLTRQYTNERMVIDCMITTLHEEFGFGRDRILKFLRAYINERKAVSALYVNNRYVDNDKHFVYAKDKHDRILRQIMGEDYPSFGERFEVDIDKPLFDGGILLGFNLEDEKHDENERQD